MSDVQSDSKALAVDEALLLNNEYRYSLFHNYERVSSWPVIRRSHESPLRLYYMVFKPFDKNYDVDYDGMSHVRRYLTRQNSKYELDHLIITREIMESKIHFNVMLWTKVDLKYLNDKFTNRYKIYCSECPLSDKYKIHDYVVKESKKRVMYPKRDIYSFDYY